MNRLQKLKEVLEIARKHKNPDMETSVLKAIEEEKDSSLQKELSLRLEAFEVDQRKKN